MFDFLKGRDLTPEETTAAMQWHLDNNVKLATNPIARASQLKLAILAIKGSGRKVVSVSGDYRPAYPHRAIGIEERYADATIRQGVEETHLIQVLRDPGLNGNIVVMLGTPGAGKTYAGCGYLLDNARFEGVSTGTWSDALYVRADGIPDLLGIGEEKQRRRDEIAKKRLVFLDDVVKGHSDAWKAWFQRFVDARYNRPQCVTLIASNLDYPAFLKEFPAPVVDRLLECAVMVECNWPSFRRRKPLGVVS